MESQLSGAHKKTYQRVFQHPMPNNLQWREVKSMLEAIPSAETLEDDKGNLKVSRNGQKLMLHRPHGKDLADKEELMQVRHFLEGSRAAVTSTAADGTLLLVVIDHHEAKIFSSELHGSVPQVVVPYNPHGFGDVLHYKQDDSNGQRKPERKSFYEAVAKTLQGGQHIVIFGAGTGASSAMEQLLAELKAHHHDVAERVVRSMVVDEKHLTEAQLLAKAREVFAEV